MLKNLTTEARNPASEAIDTLSALEIVRLMNAEDAKIAAAVAAEEEKIAAAIEAVAERFKFGGRLIYMGAGTSGRLGVLDATECPPTFNSPAGQVVGLIAGGYEALTRAIEGAEDRPELAVEDLRGIGLSEKDVVVGIATSGRTPYVIGGLQFAREQKAMTIALSCNAISAVAECADLAITPVVGPEVVSGSTRLKAGTATKLVLNMLTTGAMVRIGKTYGNLMVDLRATNTKLRDRTARIVAYLTGPSEERAVELLSECGGELKTAVVLHHLPPGESRTPEAARELLRTANGHLRRAIELAAPAPLAASLATRGAQHHDLVLGIDGGGTGTVALLARPNDPAAPTILGRGTAGPANPRAVGFASAFQAIDEAIAAAFSNAGLLRGEVGAACLALAGAGREVEREKFQHWAAARKIAGSFEQVHDALPVLTAGTPAGWGIALIAGTGSLCFGQDAAGRSARSGGWGYLFGDEGSGYWIAMSALRAVAASVDGRGRATLLVDRLLGALQLDEPSQLVSAVYGSTLDRAALAALAPIVLDLAMEQDDAAKVIALAAVLELAAMVAAVSRQLDLVEFPLALAGGVLSGSPFIRFSLEQHLLEEGLVPKTVNTVPEPAVGAVRLAAESLVAKNK